LVVLAALGATVGSALDAIHTHFGATAYSHPVVWGMAWWVPLVFGGAFTIGLARPLFDRGAGAPPSRAAALLAFAFFTIGYWVSVAPLDWWIVALLLLAIFAVSWWLCDRTALGLGIAAAGAIGGPLVESALVARGAFAHLSPVFLGVSGWLPFLYLSAAVALTTLARVLVDG
jgi:hypothetical protein